MNRKMSCEEVLSTLYAFLDKEVDAPTAADIEHHLQDCRECFSRAEFERKLKKRVADSGSVATPEAVKRRLKTLIRNF